jgi:hypothetical protein
MEELKMIKIIEESDKLIIENYQNRLINLTWLDVVDALEIKGLFIRIDNALNIPVASYHGKKYIVEDCYIELMENANRMEMLAC